MLLFRRILFYIFLLGYFTLTPLLIFYTLGYRLDLKGDAGIVKTGAFSVTTLPEGAEIRLASRKTQQKSPAVLLNLKAGDYDVQIEKEGYFVWENRIHVTAERAVVAEKIILLPKEMRPAVAAQGPFRQIQVFKEDSLVLLLKKGKKFSDLSLFDAGRSTEIRATAVQQAWWKDAEVKSLYTADDSALFWVRLERSGSPIMLRGRLRFGALEFEDYSRHFTEAPEDLQWDANVESKIYALKDGELKLMDLDRGTTSSLGRSLQGFRVFKQRLFLSDQRGVTRTDGDGSNPRRLLDDPVLSTQLFGGRERLNIGVYSGGNLLFYDTEGALFSNRLPYWLGRKAVRGYSFDSAKSQAVMWTDQRMRVVDFSRDTFLKEEAFERKLKKRWLYKNGSDLQRAFWALEGTHVFFQDGRRVYVLETASGLDSRPRFLVEAHPDFPIFLSEAQGGLYYGDVNDRHLMFLKFLPKKEILSDAFSKPGFLDEPMSRKDREK